MDASIPPGKPAQVWIGAVLLTSSGFSTVVTALPIIRLKISPTPIGLTPGFLSKGIKQGLIKYCWCVLRHCVAYLI